MPNLHPNPTPTLTPTLTLGLGLGLGLRLGLGLGMYDISLSYMMYLPVSHSIPLTSILHSAFCVLQNTPAGANANFVLASTCYYCAVTN